LAACKIQKLGIMKRTSYRLSKDGISVVEQARRMKGWKRTSNEWVQTAKASQSTLKRFLKGEAISIDCFISLCNALGIEEWQKLVDWEDNDSTRVHREPSENYPAQPEPVEPKRALVVTGCFTESQKEKVKLLVEALKKALTEADIIVSEEPFK
jgi:hypothetical protein